jgi:hypothetical protein
MGARYAVLLTPSKPSGLTQLLSCQQIAPVSPLESALLEVFILKSLKFFRINTYEKHRGRGLVIVNEIPHLTSCLPTSLLPCPAPLQSLRFRRGEE